MRKQYKASNGLSLLLLLVAVVDTTAAGRRKATAPSIATQTEQLTALGEESAGQVAGTATHVGQEVTHIGQETVQEGQRQAGNLRKAADIAGTPIAAGISNEGAALLDAARTLGLNRVVEMLENGASSPQAEDSQADSPTASAPKPSEEFDTALAPASEKETSGTAAETQPPAPSQKKTGKKKATGGAPAPSPSTAGDQLDDVPDPSFKGRELERTPEDLETYNSFMAAKAAREEAGEGVTSEASADAIPFPVIYLDQIQNMNDKELWKIFHRGTAEIPSDISQSKFAFCDRTLTLTNSIERPSGWPSIKWPNADQIFAPIQRFGWWGKFFVKQPAQNYTQFFNLVVFNDNIDFIGNASFVKGGYSADGRDSFQTDYSNGDVIPIRIGRDEWRRVGPTIFLGRGFLWIDGEDLKPKYATGIEKAAVDALEPLTNATITTILNAQKVVRRVRNLSKYTDISYPPLKAAPFAFYFAIDCQNYRIPKLHYTPIVTQALTDISKHIGLNYPTYRLPVLPAPYVKSSWNQNSPKFAAPPFQGYPKDMVDVDAATLADLASPQLDLNDPESGLEFASGPAKEDAYVLFPVALPANVTGGVPGAQAFAKLPASLLRPAFGEYWDAEEAPAAAPEAAPEVEGAAESARAAPEARTDEN